MRADSMFDLIFGRTRPDREPYQGPRLTLLMRSGARFAVVYHSRKAADTDRDLLYAAMQADRPTMVVGSATVRVSEVAAAYTSG
jgi:hypothetical protein